MCTTCTSGYFLPFTLLTTEAFLPPNILVLTLGP